MAVKDWIVESTESQFDKFAKHRQLVKSTSLSCAANMPDNFYENVQNQSNNNPSGSNQAYENQSIIKRHREEQQVGIYYNVFKRKLLLNSI